MSAVINISKIAKSYREMPELLMLDVIMRNTPRPDTAVFKFKTKRRYNAGYHHWFLLLLQVRQEKQGTVQ